MPGSCNVTGRADQLQLRDLIEQGMVVSWHPKFPDKAGEKPDKWDIVLARGDYDENFTTIKAQ